MLKWVLTLAAALLIECVGGTRGRVLVGGAFHSAGEGGRIPAKHFVKWNGLGWEEFFVPFSGAVYALKKVGNSIFVTGNFSSPSSGSAVLDTRGSYSTSFAVHSYHLSGVSGDFEDDFEDEGGDDDEESGGDEPFDPVEGVARSGGGLRVPSSARRLASTPSSAFVGAGYTIEYRGSTLVLGGDISLGGSLLGSTPNLVYWTFGSSTSWTAATDPGLQQLPPVRKLLLHPTQKLLFMGLLASSASPLSSLVASCVWQTDGGCHNGAYADMGTLPGRVVNDLLLLPSGLLVAGGDFQAQAGSNVAVWDTRKTLSRWTALGGGLDGPVSSLAYVPSRHWLVVAGSFTSALSLNGSAVHSPRIAVWQLASKQWMALPGGAVQLPASHSAAAATHVYALQDVGDALIVAGKFTAVGGSGSGSGARGSGAAAVQSANIAAYVYDSASWQSMGGVNGAVYALSADPKQLSQLLTALTVAVAMFLLGLVCIGICFARGSLAREAAPTALVDRVAIRAASSAGKQAAAQLSALMRSWLLYMLTPTAVSAVAVAAAGCVVTQRPWFDAAFTTKLWAPAMDIPLGLYVSLPIMLYTLHWMLAACRGSVSLVALNASSTATLARSSGILSSYTLWAVICLFLVWQDPISPLPGVLNSVLVIAVLQGVHIAAGQLLTRSVGSLAGGKVMTQPRQVTIQVLAYSALLHLVYSSASSAILAMQTTVSKFLFSVLVPGLKLTSLLQLALSSALRARRAAASAAAVASGGAAAYSSAPLLTEARAQSDAEAAAAAGGAADGIVRESGCAARAKRALYAALSVTLAEDDWRALQLLLLLQRLLVTVVDLALFSGYSPVTPVLLTVTTAVDLLLCKRLAILSALPATRLSMADIRFLLHVTAGACLAIAPFNAGLFLFFRPPTFIGPGMSLALVVTMGLLFSVAGMTAGTLLALLAIMACMGFAAAIMAFVYAGSLSTTVPAITWLACAGLLVCTVSIKKDDWKKSAKKKSAKKAKAAKK